MSMAKDHGSSVKNDKQYEGLRKKGMSKSRAAAISNSEGSSSRGGKSSGSSRSRKSSGSGSGGNTAPKKAARPKGGRAAAKSRWRARRTGRGARVHYPAMDLTLSPSEQEFRDELRPWLADNHP